MGRARFSRFSRCASSERRCGTALAFMATSSACVSAWRCSSEPSVLEPVLYVLTKATPRPALDGAAAAGGAASSGVHARGAGVEAEAEACTTASITQTTLADDGERGNATLSRVSSPELTAPQPRPRQKPWTPTNAWPAAINQPAASASPPLPPKTATGAHDELRPSHAKISA